MVAGGDLDIVNYEFDVKFPVDSGTNKAGYVFAHDGDKTYYAVVLDRNAGKISLHYVDAGSWGGALASADATINDSTTYTVKVIRKQRRVEGRIVGQASAAVAAQDRARTLTLSRCVVPLQRGGLATPPGLCARWTAPRQSCARHA